MPNTRQVLQYAEDNGLLAVGQTVDSVLNAYGKNTVTDGVARQQTYDPDKWRNGGGRTEPDSGEFTPGLAGLSNA